MYEKKFFFSYIKIIFFILFVSFVAFNESLNKKSEIYKDVYEPFLPNNNKEFAVKSYNKTKFNINHPRFHFQEKYKNRKLFKINYSYYPYTFINKSLSFKDNANFLYNTTGMLNVTKLEYFYYHQNINIFDFNNIHLAMSFDKNVSDLSTISIASILNTSNSDTYIHFHILGLNFQFDEIKKIIDLRKINNKVEFIFYNSEQVKYDFELGKQDKRGLANYAKILIPQIVNNTNKILILDSVDILSQKDLTEIYFYDIGNNYFGWIIERCAGNIFIYEDKFMTNNFHPNTGVLLVNIRLFRKDELNYLVFVKICQLLDIKKLYLLENLIIILKVPLKIFL